MTTLTTVYKGDMLFEASNGSHTISIDVPTGMGGQDRGFMPPQLFIVSLGACVAALIAEYCESHDINTTGLEVDINYDKFDKPSRMENIKAVVKLPNATVEKREKALRHVAKHCPVHETIMITDSMDIEILDQTTLVTNN
jgi:putative redox protein